MICKELLSTTWNKKKNEITDQSALGVVSEKIKVS